MKGVSNTCGRLLHLRGSMQLRLHLRHRCLHLPAAVRHVCGVRRLHQLKVVLGGGDRPLLASLLRQPSRLLHMIHTPSRTDH
jgi:hypothetical protein